MPAAHPVIDADVSGRPVRRRGGSMTPSREHLTAEVIKAIRTLKYSFFSCYKFQEERLLGLVKLLQEAESRGILVTEAVSLAKTSFFGCSGSHAT